VGTHSGPGTASAAAALAEKGSDLPSGAAAATPLWKRPLVLALLLFVITAALYSPVHHHPFIDYDDGVYVTNNDHVKYGLHRQNLKGAIEWAMTTYDAANWHPVTWLSHMLDYRLFGGNPAGHHDVNLLLHALNAAILFLVLLRATGCTGPSLMVAALFALHPINVESVVWISERKNLLSMFFFLLTLGAWRWYACKPKWYRYLAVALLFALGLMSKPQVITLPFVLLLWDYWPLERLAFRSSPFSLRQNAGGDSSGEKRRAKSEERSIAKHGWPFLLLEKLPLLALCAGSALLTVKAQWKGGSFNPDYTFFQRLENAIVCYVRYIGKAFWPSHLALLYPHPGNSLKLWQAGLALLVLLAVSVFVLRSRRRRYLTVGWLWFLGTLVPMIGLVQVGRQAMADRYAYLPFLGLFIMVCWGVPDFLALAAKADAGAGRRQLSPAWLAVPACVVLLVLAGLTHRQIGYWRNDVAVWTHTAEVTGGNYIAEDNLGDALLKANRPDDAEKHFRRAAAIYPTYPPTLMALAVQDQRDGKLRQAIAEYSEAISGTQHSSYPDKSIMGAAYGNMGHAYRELGELAQARESLQAAVTLNPNNFQAWEDLGLVSQHMGDLTTAIHAYYQAVKLHPYDLGYLLLAQALKKSGHKLEAQWAAERAKNLTVDYERAQQLTARILAQ
jgi:tetratricopeptide (TPR) repeat protein